MARQEFISSVSSLHPAIQAMQGHASRAPWWAGRRAQRALTGLEQALWAVAVSQCARRCAGPAAGSISVRTSRPHRFVFASPSHAVHRAAASHRPVCLLVFVVRTCTPSQRDAESSVSVEDPPPGARCVRQRVAGRVSADRRLVAGRLRSGSWSARARVANLGSVRGSRGLWSGAAPWRMCSRFTGLTASGRWTGAFGQRSACCRRVLWASWRASSMGLSSLTCRRRRLERPHSCEYLRSELEAARGAASCDVALHSPGIEYERLGPSQCLRSGPSTARAGVAMFGVDERQRASDSLDLGRGSGPAAEA